MGSVAAQCEESREASVNSGWTDQNLHLARSSIKSREDVRHSWRDQLLLNIYNREIKKAGRAWSYQQRLMWILVRAPPSTPWGWRLHVNQAHSSSGAAWDKWGNWNYAGQLYHDQVCQSHQEGRVTLLRWTEFKLFSEETPCQSVIFKRLSSNKHFPDNFILNSLSPQVLGSYSQKENGSFTEEKLGEHQGVQVSITNNGTQTSSGP